MLKAPFPWFGGKSRVAAQVWERFGDVPNYVEPFAGSLAVLLGRPTAAGTETVNDLDCYLANFWRAVAADPVGVSSWAAWPVNEADLIARHRWLLEQRDFRERMRLDPAYHETWMTLLDTFLDALRASGYFPPENGEDAVEIVLERFGGNSAHREDK